MKGQRSHHMSSRGRACGSCDLNRYFTKCLVTIRTWPGSSCSRQCRQQQQRQCEEATPATGKQFKRQHQCSPPPGYQTLRSPHTRLPTASRAVPAPFFFQTDHAATSLAARMRSKPSGLGARPTSRTQPRQHRTITRAAADGVTSSPIGDPAVAGGIALVMATGVINRVLYKMALNPLGNYVFFLAQLQTFGYCLCYFTFLFVRKRQGIVTDEMIAAPDKRLFALNGLLEAMSQLLGLVGASKLPGVVLPLFQQTVLIFTIGFGYLILGKKLKPVQIIGALLVGGGVGYAALPAGGSAGVLTEVDPKYALIFIASMIFPALSSIIKEKIFTDAKEKLGGKQLDLFVVNSFGSLSQAAFVILFLPVLTSLRGIPLSGLPSYLADGFTCFIGGSPSCGSDCSAAPLLPLLYVAFNLAFNISILQLLRSAGNVVQSIVLASIVPITIYAFTLPLPYLPAPPELGPNFLIGTLILMGGLATYQSPNWLPAAQKKFKSS